MEKLILDILIKIGIMSIELAISIAGHGYIQVEVWSYPKFGDFKTLDILE